MNKEELRSLVEQLLKELPDEPQVKGAYTPTTLGPEKKESGYQDGDFVEDITKLDLRKLYLVKDPRDEAAFRRLKERTPARLGSGRAGPRYKTLTMLRFRADHAAAQDAVFSELPEDFGKSLGMLSVKTRCESKDQYLTRPDLGRQFDQEAQSLLRQTLPQNPKVQLVVGDGLSGAAVAANAPDCLAAIRDGLKLRGIEATDAVFVRYCRVGAGDAIGDITGCKLVCMLVGERPGLVTDKSMSCYLTYMPHTGIPESSRTVVSNIHAQGTPAAEAGAHIAGLIETILKKGASGVALQMEGAL